jgi:predicted house-cleaning noncanonical NTP pyrophosphatase (MazG superfamily)
VNRIEEIINHYGRTAQIYKCIEELQELEKALDEYCINQNFSDNVIDELADVTIMVQQLVTSFGQEAVEERIKFKLDRQMRRINEDLQHLR